MKLVFVLQPRFLHPLERMGVVRAIHELPLLVVFEGHFLFPENGGDQTVHDAIIQAMLHPCDFTQPQETT
jgi:hypothetical protein